MSSLMNKNSRGSSEIGAINLLLGVPVSDTSFDLSVSFSALMDSFSALSLSLSILLAADVGRSESYFSSAEISRGLGSFAISFLSAELRLLSLILSASDMVLAASDCFLWDSAER